MIVSALSPCSKLALHVSLCDLVPRFVQRGALKLQGVRILGDLCRQAWSLSGTQTSRCVPQGAAPYDWRLALANNEYRDSFFTDLKARIQLMHGTAGKKVCRLFRPALQAWLVSFSARSYKVLFLRCCKKQATSLA